MRGAKKIDPTFGSAAPDTPGGETTAITNNTPDLFGVTPAATSVPTPADATTSKISTAPSSQIKDLDISSFSSTSSSTSSCSTTTPSSSSSTVNRSKSRRHSVVTPGTENLNSNAGISNSTSCSNINDNNNNNNINSINGCDDKVVEPTRRKSTPSTSSYSLFIAGGDDISNNNINNNNYKREESNGLVGFKSESSSKRRPDRVSTSSADSATTTNTTMDQNASRTKRVWKALSVASGEISKEKDKVLGFFRNRLRSKRGRKETSVKEIHIGPEIYDDKWASRATSSTSNCSRASNGSMKYSNGSHSSSSRESTTLEVVHDMDEEYNPEYT